MIQGTSPVNIFELPFEAALAKEIRAVYLQNGVEVLRKETAELKKEDRFVGVSLTQEETLSFDHECNVEIQLQVFTTEGMPYVSPIYVVSAKKCLSNEVIS